MCMGRGFEGDPCRGSIPHGRRNAPGNIMAMQVTQNKHKQETQIQTHTVHTWTHSWRQSETELRQYFMRQESGLQSTIPAISYLVGRLLETRPNQTCQVWSVKKHGILNSAHTHTVGSFFCFAFLFSVEILWPSILTL